MLGRLEAVLLKLTLPKFDPDMLKFDPVPDVVNVPLLLKVPLEVTVLPPAARVAPEAIVTFVDVRLPPKESVPPFKVSVVSERFPEVVPPFERVSVVPMLSVPPFRARVDAVTAPDDVPPLAKVSVP